MNKELVNKKYNQNQTSNQTSNQISNQISNQTPKDQNIKGMILPPTSELKKQIYGSPRLGINLFMGMIDFALLYLYETVYTLNPILVGVALMLGKLSIAAAQFLVSWWSDHTKSKWGRRKPFLIIEAPILAISFLLLLLPGVILGPNPPELTLFAWFAIFNMIAQASYSVTSVYHSWTAEQFPVYERPRVSQIQNVYNFIGLGVIVLFSFLVLTDVKVQLAEDPSNIPPKFLWSVIIFALLMIGLIYFCAFYMPVEKTPIYDTNYKDELKLLLKNKNYLAVTFVHGFSSLGWALVNAIMLGYIDHVLMLEGLNLYIAAGLLMVGLLGAIEYWRRRIEKVGKKKTLLSVFLLAIIAFPSSLFGMFSFAANIYFAIVFVFFLATTQAGWAIFPYILYADLAEDFEKQHGELKAGLFTGFPSILLNLFQAVSLLFTGFILDLRKIENVPGNRFSLGYVIWGPVCSVIFLITYFFIKKYINLDFKWEKEVREAKNKLKEHEK